MNYLGEGRDPRLLGITSASGYRHERSEPITRVKRATSVYQDGIRLQGDTSTISSINGRLSISANIGSDSGK